MRGLLLSLLLTLVPLVGCDGMDGSGSEASATPRSLAALVIQYLPQTPTAAYAVHDSNWTTAKLEFGPDPAKPDTVQVGVRQVEKGSNELTRELCTGCDVQKLGDGSTLHITRGDRLPGAGLGEISYVRLSLFRETEEVELTYEGRPIRVDGEAKGNDLDVGSLVDIVKDPNMGVHTVQGLLDDGKTLSMWRD